MKNLANAFERLINRIIAILRQLFKLTGSPVFSNVVYFSNGSALSVYGRVIEEAPFIDFEDKRSGAAHFFKVIRLFISFKVPNVNISVDGFTCSTQSNEEGYFCLQVEGLEFKKGQHEIELLLKGKSNGEDIEKVSISKKILIQGNDQLIDEIFISDIDDTVIKSRATSFWRLAFNTLFLPPQKRRAFPEASKAYQEMISKTQYGRFFYVSSSTWNIYPLLSSFLKINGFPNGPILLQDMVGDKSEDSAMAHGHKLKKILQLAKLYPNAPLTLIGDAGQEDAAIYLAVAREHKNRIKKILIRKTWWESVFSEPNDILKEAHELGVELHYFETLEELKT